MRGGGQLWCKSCYILSPVMLLLSIFKSSNGLVAVPGHWKLLSCTEVSWTRSLTTRKTLARSEDRRYLKQPQYHRFQANAVPCESLVGNQRAKHPPSKQFAPKFLVSARQTDAMEPLAETIVDKLASHGIVVVSNFLSQEHLEGMQVELSEKMGQGMFKDADIGRGKDQKHRPDVRGDKIAWINGVHDVSSQASLQVLKDLELIRQLINQRLFLGVFELECHFASYSPGTFYVKHVDQVRT
eukprot:750861-Hanusia_phi.AAC.1